MNIDQAEVGVARGFRRLSVMAAMVLLAAARMVAAATPHYEVVERWKIGGAGGWDYVTIDSVRHRLFITRGDHADVVDTTSGKVIGSIPGGGGAHGVALAPDLNRGFISNGAGNSVTEFDYTTLAALRTVGVKGENPDAILYDATTRRVLTFNGKSHDVTVLDAVKMEIIAKIAVPGKPEFVRADGHGKVFANIETDPGQLVLIDIAAARVDAVWKLEGCDSPSGLAFDRAHSRLFSVCDDKVMAVTDAVTGKLVEHVPIGEGPDAAEYDDSRAIAFSSNGQDGTLTVAQQVDPNKYLVRQTVATQRGARTMALDPANDRIYLVTAEFEPVPAGSKARPVMIPDTFTVIVVAPH
ncbi:MAG: YncE family protein [Steroidobacteraceae bacterium]